MSANHLYLVTGGAGFIGSHITTALVQRGDRVRVLTGKFRGKEGEVMTVLPKDNKVIIDGVNVAKRHQKPTRAMQQGGIIDKAMPIDASNVALIDTDGKATRAGYRIDADGTKSRIARRSGGVL